MSLKTPILAALVAAVAGCSGQAQLKPIDYADAGTTAAAIAQGAVESNPIVGIAGDAAAPVVALGVKYATKKVLIKRGYTPCQADGIVGTGSAFGVGNNVMVLIGASGPLAALVGVGVAAAYYQQKDCSHERG